VEESRYSPSISTSHIRKSIFIRTQIELEFLTNLRKITNP